MHLTNEKLNKLKCFLKIFFKCNINVLIMVVYIPKVYDLRRLTNRVYLCVPLRSVMLSNVVYVIVILGGICIIQNTGLECEPTISKGRNSYLEVSGYVYLECDFESCGNIETITYEKNIAIPQTWVPVFEGVNETYSRALDTHHAYSLKGRTVYVAFTSVHTLSITPSILEDQGEWRCAVHDENETKIASQPMQINYGTCTPVISEGLGSQREINGDTSLVCDLCGSFNKLIFDKKNKDDKWTHLYIANTTHNHAINASNDDSSLVNRTRYVILPKRHILNIKLLQLNDGGKWRCVTVHLNDVRKESNTIEIFIANPVEHTTSYIPKIDVVLKDTTFRYVCNIDKTYVEPPLSWTLNGKDINPKDNEVHPNDNPWYDVLELPIDIARNSNIGCKIKFKGKSGIWTSNSIVVDIEAISRYSYSTQTPSNPCDVRGLVIVTIVLVLLVVVQMLIGLLCLSKYLKQSKTGRGQHPNSTSTEEPLMPNNTGDSTGAARQ